MNTLAKTLLASVAGTALFASAAIAQNSDENNILSGVTSTVTDAVDSTVDAVDDVTGNVTNDLGVGDVTSGVSDTVDDVTTSVTGGDITGGDVTGGDTSVDGVIGDVTGGDSAIGDIGSFSNLIGNIESGNFDISDVSDISEIRVIDVQDAFNDFDATAFNDAVSGNSANVSELQNSISGNQLLNDSLNAGGIDVSNIVGIENNSDNSVTIYTVNRD